MTIKIADQFELWPTARLKRYERNSRIHTPEQVRGIAAMPAPIMVAGQPFVAANDDAFTARRRA